DSIHLDSWVTGAKAMASSVDGSGLESCFERMKRLRDGYTGIPGSMGFQIVAGESAGSIITFRGPVRRSRYGASEVRHESAACCRPAAVILVWVSFSASAKVAVVTGGPDPTAVPNVGGAPGVTGGVVEGVCELAGGAPLQAGAAINTPSGARIRNWRRVFI